MDLFAFLNQPIVLTLLSLTIGGYLLSLLSDRRARKDKIRDKAIELITEISNDVNAVTAHLFGIIRSQAVQGRDFALLNERVGHLLTQRMSVRVRSAAYLKSEEFYPKYNIVVWELRRVREFLIRLSELSEGAEVEQLITEVQHWQNWLSQAWPFEIKKKVERPELYIPFDEFYNWGEMLVDRATWLFTSNLKSALK